MNRNIITGLLATAVAIAVFIGIQKHSFTTKPSQPPPLTAEKKEQPWLAPDSNTIPHSVTGDLIRYGRELIAHTARYLGPRGKVASISNGMNCQNCHLEAGTKPWGNNYSAVAANYPLYRDRSGTVESIEKRVNDCFERSLNGHPLDSTSHEMRAMVAYIQWLGTYVPKGKKPLGTGIAALTWLNRAADTVKGKVVFMQKCQSCHGANGQGQLDTITGAGYLYPPLWGPHSYNIGAGLYRLSKMAGYVKDNMPFGASHGNTLLTDEQAWDVAAFINAQSRPFKDLSKDWPKKGSCPIDYPFGPYTDTFPEQQHKFGPFKPIEDGKKPKLKSQGPKK